MLYGLKSLSLGATIKKDEMSETALKKEKRERGNTIIEYFLQGLYLPSFPRDTENTLGFDASWNGLDVGDALGDNGRNPIWILFSIQNGGYVHSYRPVWLRIVFAFLQ